MKNYKIIETRPELSAAQVAQGMDFSTIKTKATMASKTTIATFSVKTIILNGVAGAILVGGTIVAVKKFKKESFQESKQTVSYTEPQKSTKGALLLSRDSIAELKEIVKPVTATTPTKSPVRASAVTSVIPTQTVPATQTVQFINEVSAGTNTSSTLVNSASTESTTQVKAAKIDNFKPSENVTFKFIELTTNACLALVPHNSPTGIECNLGCEFKYIDCDELSAIPYIRVVRLTIINPQSKIVLKRHFENIKLIHKGKTHFPLALYLGDTDPETKKPKFFHEKFISKGATLKTGSTVEIIMIIKEPIEVGDKLIFDNYRAILVE
jgi:hypothetical protein